MVITNNKKLTKNYGGFFVFLLIAYLVESLVFGFNKTKKSAKSQIFKFIFSLNYSQMP